MEGKRLNYAVASGYYVAVRFVSVPYFGNPKNVQLNSSDVLYNSGWVQSGSHIVPTGTKSAVLVFRNADNTQIAPSAASNVVFTIERTITDAINILSKQEPEETNSFVIGTDLLKKPVYTKKIGVLTYLQAYCIYGGKYYSTDGANIAEQGSDFSIIRSGAINLGHGNSFQLVSGGKAWASGWDDNKMYRVDLSTLTIDLTITLPTIGYTTAAVNEDAGLMYIFQRDTYPSTEAAYNFIVYDYNNGIVKSTRTIESFAAMQGVDYYQGKILMVYGLGSSAAPSGMRIYNTAGDVLSAFVLSVLDGREPEGICFDRDNLELSVSDVDRNLFIVY
jgi:hypothetical protein